MANARTRGLGKQATRSLVPASLLLGLAVSAATLLGVTDVAAREMAGWRVVGAGPAGIHEGRKYSLYNLDQKSYLRYRDRRGANLGWSGSPNEAMRVRRRGGGAGPIKCGEVFALFIEREWIIYGEQTTGINLTSRTQLSDASFQWKFGGCLSGQVIQRDQPVTLVNIPAGDSVVGCRRVWGVNLCWADTTVTVGGQNFHKDALPGIP